MQKSHVIITIIILIVFGLLWWRGSPKAPSTGDSVEWIDLSKLKLGPIQHDLLSDEQLRRLERIHRTFGAVDGFTLENRIDGFKRDHDPDRELAIWERMANAFDRFDESRQLTQEEKKELYRIVLLRSMASEEEVLARQKQQLLSKEDIAAILRGF